MYGKYVDGKFKRAPYRITEVEALAQGYKPVVLTPAPETDETHYPREWLEETDTAIVRHWNVVEIEPEPEPELTEAEALEILLGGAT